jgi:hypothetical protein
MDLMSYRRTHKRLSLVNSARKPLILRMGVRNELTQRPLNLLFYGPEFNAAVKIKAPKPNATSIAPRYARHQLPPIDFRIVGPIEAGQGRKVSKRTLDFVIAVATSRILYSDRAFKYIGFAIRMELQPI